MKYQNTIPARVVAAMGGAALMLTMTPSGAASDQYANASRNYDTYCVQCHGMNRDGKGINSRDMSVQPRDHSDAKGMEDIPDDELLHAIKDGGLAVNKSVLMPAWGNVLTEDEIREMVAYLRHICNCGLDQ